MCATWAEVQSYGARQYSGNNGQDSAPAILLPLPGCVHNMRHEIPSCLPYTPSPIPTTTQQRCPWPLPLSTISARLLPSVTPCGHTPMPHTPRLRLRPIFTVSFHMHMDTLWLPAPLLPHPPTPQDDFKAMNILLPTHYVLIAKRCFKSMRDNDFKVGAREGGLMGGWIGGGRKTMNTYSGQQQCRRRSACCVHSQVMKAAICGVQNAGARARVQCGCGPVEAYGLALVHRSLLARFCCLERAGVREELLRRPWITDA